MPHPEDAGSCSDTPTTPNGGSGHPRQAGANGVTLDLRDVDTGGSPMSVTAYVLIQTEVGRAEKVAKAARDIAGVVTSDNVAGPYDVIVKAEAESLDELGQLVVSAIQRVDGVTRTSTCPTSTR